MPKLKKNLKPRFEQLIDKFMNEQAAPGVFRKRTWKEAVWDCSNCRHCNDRSDIGVIDLEGYWLLLWAIFKPDFYRMYRAVESARAQSEKPS